MLVKYADIIIDISHEAIDRVFQYEIPYSLREELTLGTEVLIPFGQGNTMRKGYVVGISDTPNYDVDKIKSIDSIVEGSIVIESTLIKLAEYIRSNYGSTMINALKTVMPVKKRIKNVEKKTVILNVTLEEARTITANYSKRSKAKLRLVNELIEEQVLPYDLVVGKLNISAATLKKLEEEQVIVIKTDTIRRNPIKSRGEEGITHILNDTQQHLVDEFNSDFDNEEYKTYLLHGVTGSGKTEVYIEAIEHVISKGKEAIVLIPEIALTYQTVKRFRHRFGDRVTVINSKLSAGEKYDQFLRAKKKEVDIVIGPRSALFTPFNDLGLIIIDEEHEGSYKSDMPPKYHAREVAIKRADMCNASVILGSATPSVESYYKAKAGEYVLWNMNDRAANAKLPNVEVVDLREELKTGNRSPISQRLQTLVRDRLEKKQQIMLFLNKRGYSSFVSCRSCGKVVKCPHCDVSLTIHNNGKLMCHYCGYSETYDRICKACGSKYVGGFNPGTQKIEEQVREMFPGVKTLRMDMDTTRNKNSYDDILSKFSSGEADILIGTQMIVKGHDFSNVSLVGILLADLSMFSNDYRSGEKTFDLLTQAAGRAGRGDIAGDVIIQTYNPDNYALVAASHQDYTDFYENEIAYRELMNYPPIWNMLVIFMVSKSENIVDKAAEDIVSILKGKYKDEIVIIGPTVATISKVKDLNRRVVYIKNALYNELVKVKDYVESYTEDNEAYKGVMIAFDFNPMNMY